MRLHYYTPAVPQSYCVGVHNGHGLGSLFARLFSKIAASTASKAALQVAKQAGREAMKVATTRGSELAKHAAKQAVVKAAEAGGEFASQKIKNMTERALKTSLPKELVHSIDAAAKEGVQAAVKKASVATSVANTLIDKGVTEVEKAVGIEKKTGRKRKTTKLPGKPKRFRARYELDNIINSA